MDALMWSFSCRRRCNSRPLISQSSFTSASINGNAAGPSYRVYIRFAAGWLILLRQHRAVQSPSLGRSRLIACAIELQLFPYCTCNRFIRILSSAEKLVKYGMALQLWTERPVLFNLSVLIPPIYLPLYFSASTRGLLMAYHFVIIAIRPVVHR